MLQLDSLSHGKKSYFLLALFLISFCIYIPVLKAPFFWDDFHKVPGLVDNPTVKDATESRPLRKLSLYFDSFLWKLNPGGYHFTNLILNSLAVMLAFYFVEFFFKDNIFAFLVSILFALHPAHVETVAWIKNRTEILAFIFFIAAFFFFFKKRWLSYILFILALLSKQSSAIFPMVLTLYLYLFGQKEKLKETLPYWIMALLPGIGSLFFITDIVGVGKPETLGLHILTVIKTYAFYFYMMFFPVRLNIEWRLGLDYGSLSTFLSVFAVIIFFMGLYAARKNKELFFFLAVLFISLLPYSNIIYLAGRPWAEQRLYFPVFIFSILLCMAAALKKEYRYIILVLIAAYGIRTGLRVQQWAEPQKLMDEAKLYTPNLGRIDFNMGSMYYEKGEYLKAKDHFLRAYELDGEKYYYRTLINLGLVFMKLGDLKNAENSLMKVTEIDPNYVPAYYNLGIVYLNMKDYPKAIINFEKAKTLEPGQIQIYNNLAVAYQDNKEPLKAIEALKNVLKIKPDYVNAKYNLIVIYKKSGHIKEALEEVKTELRKKPDDPVFLNFYKELSVGNKPN